MYDNKSNAATRQPLVNEHKNLHAYTQKQGGGGGGGGGVGGLSSRHSSALLQHRVYIE